MSIVNGAYVGSMYAFKSGWQVTDYSTIEISRAGAYPDADGSDIYHTAVVKFTVPAFSGVSQSIDFKMWANRMDVNYPSTINLRYAICKADTNKNSYMQTSAEVTDSNQIASGTLTLTNVSTASGSATWQTITIETDALTEGTWYLMLWGASTPSASEVLVMQGTAYHDSITLTYGDPPDEPDPEEPDPNPDPDPEPEPEPDPEPDPEPEEPEITFDTKSLQLGISAGLLSGNWYNEVPQKTIRSISGTISCELWYDTTNVSGGRTYYRIGRGDMRLTVVEFNEDMTSYKVIEKGTEFEWTCNLKISAHTKYLYFTGLGEESATKAPDNRFITYYGNVHGVDPFFQAPYLGTYGKDYETLRWHNKSSTNYAGRKTKISPVAIDVNGERRLGLLWESTHDTSGNADLLRSLTMVRPKTESGAAKILEMPIEIDSVFVPDWNIYLKGVEIGHRLKVLGKDTIVVDIDVLYATFDKYTAVSKIGEFDDVSNGEVTAFNLGSNEHIAYQNGHLTIRDKVGTINVTYPAGWTCTCSNGGTRLTAPDTSGTCSFTVEGLYGSWEVICTDGTAKLSKTVSLTDEGEVANVEFNPVTGTVNVTYPAGWTCTCNDELTAPDTSGSWTFSVTFDKDNVWSGSISATDGTTTLSQNARLTSTLLTSTITLSNEA